MEDLLIETIEKLEYPIFRQGSLGKDEAYPESFFTFWNNTADGNEFYNNEENSTIWVFDLNFYSSDHSLVYTELLKAKKALQKKGFIVFGKGHDVASDEVTHIGRGLNVQIIEK